MTINQIDEAISDTTSKSRLSLKPESERDNVKKDSTSFTAYRYRREEEHALIHPDGRKNDDYICDEGQIT